ncbi:methionyl-tRNA formyltransferase [Candidatus Collierbacteria bacterium]|nr:methionyl-tRNA formyltransferase [Candidatus Collierbacteria bacterium]
MTNLVYFGSPAFSAEILESLIKNSPPSEGGDKEGVLFCLAGVVTQPDKPLGRKQILTPSPVAQLATEYNLPVFKPEKLDEANLAHLKLLKPDLFLVVSYGKIIPKPWLTASTIGTFNLHFSLLPKYRGALCISEAIKNQDSETGVTLMAMDEGMDTGPIISQEKVSIDINDNCETLTNKLTQGGIKLLAEYLPKISSLTSPSSPSPYQGEGRGEVLLTHQNETLATYTSTTKTRNRQSAFIPWEEIKPCLEKSQMSNEQCQMSNVKCERIHALIRSLNPDPGAWTKIGNLELKIIRTSLENYLKIKNCKLKIDLVQLPGKTPISWQQFQSRTDPTKSAI